MATLILGVSSSIAIYKSLELISRLRKDSFEIYPILSHNAQKMIAPSVFHAVSGQVVHQDAFDESRPEAMEHIRLAKKADGMIFLPATANLIAKLASGVADDLMTTTYLCMKGPILVYPAMNPQMWAHAATRENVALLERRGVEIFPPVEGQVACGDYGVGRLEDIDKAHATLRARFAVPSKVSPLSGKRVLVTGGGSQEVIDPVRVISNRSSGKMAHHLLRTFLARGANVTYLRGHITDPIPPGVPVESFFSTEDLLGKLKTMVRDFDVIVMAAAPGDFRVKDPEVNKIKHRDSWRLELVRNPDLLASLSKRKGQVFVGFAAETQSIEANARAKLAAKQIDLIVGNCVSGTIRGKPLGIGTDMTSIMILDAKGVLFQAEGILKSRAAEHIASEIEQKLKG